MYVFIIIKFATLAYFEDECLLYNQICSNLVLFRSWVPVLYLSVSVSLCPSVFLSYSYLLSLLSFSLLHTPWLSLHIACPDLQPWLILTDCSPSICLGSLKTGMPNLGWLQNSLAKQNSPALCSVQHWVLHTPHVTAGSTSYAKHKYCYVLPVATQV